MDGVDLDWRLSAVSETERTLELTKARMPVEERLITLRMSELPLAHIIEATAAATKTERKVAEVIAHLDELDVDPKASVNAARAIYRGAGLKSSDDALTKAVHLRKMRYVKPRNARETGASDEALRNDGKRYA